MSSNKITQDRYEMIYIKQNNVVIIHREPYTVSILTKERLSIAVTIVMPALIISKKTA